MKAKVFAALAVSLMAMTAFGILFAHSDDSDAVPNVVPGQTIVFDFYGYTTDEGSWWINDSSGNWFNDRYYGIDWEYVGWTPTEGTHVRYTVHIGSDMPYGQYTLRVEWYNVEDYWIEDEADFAFTVGPNTYTVTFNGNGGSSAQPSVTASSGSKITLPSASKQYCTFSGWYTAASGGTRVGGAGDQYTVAGNITLYAQYNVIPVSFTTVQDTAYIVQGSSFSYTAGTSPADASLSVSGASWLSVSGKNVAGTASPSVNPGTYHVTLTAFYGNQSAVQTFDIVVVEKLIFESVPTGGIIALPA